MPLDRPTVSLDDKYVAESGRVRRGVHDLGRVLHVVQSDQVGQLVEHETARHGGPHGIGESFCVESPMIIT